MQALPAKSIEQPTDWKKPLPRVLCALHLNPTQKFGTLEEQLVFLSEAFRREGGVFLPLFMSRPDTNDLTPFDHHGVEAFALSMERLRWRSLYQLAWLVKDRQIEIVHWNFTAPLLNPYLWGLTVLRPWVKHFYTDHHSREGPVARTSGWKAALKHLFLKRYAQVWCVSRFVQECADLEYTWRRTQCSMHFVNTERFQPDAAVRAEMRAKYSVAHRFVLTIVAQLMPFKGIDLALRAVSRLPEEAVLWLVGSGTFLEGLRRLADELGLKDRVRFWGVQPHVEPFLQASDVFALPSRWQEAAGLSLLEAQAVGLPAVATRIGGIPEYVEEGRTGLLFAPENVDELTAHLRTLLLDPERRARMGQAARALALERFAPACQLNEWLDFYRQR